jgi:hypothetical protein
MIGSSLIALSLVLGLAPAEDTHTIKVKKSAKGDVVKVEDQEDGDSNMVLTVGGKEVPNQKGPGKIGKNEVYVETILEKPEKAEKATSLKRKYEKARFTKEGKEGTRVYEGKIVLIEKKGDKYQFQIEDGKELTGKDAEALDKEFNKKEGVSDDELEKLILPGKPIKVGDTWKIDADKLFKTMVREAGLGGEGSKASGKLLEVHEKGGRKFGKMDIELESPITKFGDDPKVKFAIADGAKLKMVFHLDACIDGTSTDATMKVEMSLDMEATFDAGGMEAKMVMHAKNLATKKGTEQAKK